MNEIDALSDEEGLPVIAQPAQDVQREAVSRFSKLKQDEKFLTLMETVGKELSQVLTDEKQDEVEAQQ